MRDFMSIIILAVIIAIAIAQDGGINLGECSNYAVFAQTAITFDGTVSTIGTGSLGVSPGTSITGNIIVRNGALLGAQSTSAIACLANKRTASLIASVKGSASNLEMSPASLIPIADLSGKTFSPGVYKSNESIIISDGSVTLSGNGVYIFQTAKSLYTSSWTKVVLEDGAEAANIYWSVGTQATLGANRYIYMCTYICVFMYVCIHVCMYTCKCENVNMYMYI
jgi:hypothetical protein